MAKVRNLITPGGKGNVTKTASLEVRGGFFGTEAAGGHGGALEIYGGMSGTTVDKVRIEMSGAAPGDQFGSTEQETLRSVPVR